MKSFTLELRDFGPVTVFYDSNGTLPQHIEDENEIEVNFASLSKTDRIMVMQGFEQAKSYDVLMGLQNEFMDEACDFWEKINEVHE